ncbi:hypothetical protein CK203_055772 [Vitis vinifera]|uniref:Uncharacterized protein n=1 Tax=Vitis vinifera TaxID=29760 RepID=A0A438H134_VITVI|nr:hypothetical protein CK203_055772 [Vitis vinifera]
MSTIKGAASSGLSGDVHEKSVDKLSVKEFRERFSIPNGVVVELMDGEAMSTEKTEDHAIVFSKEQINAGLQFPLPSLFKEFFHFTQIPPACIHPNIVRVLMGCNILNMLFNLDLSLLEVFFAYSLKKGKNDIFSMAAHLPSLQLVTELSDSTKGGSEGTYVGPGFLGWSSGASGEAIFPKPFVGASGPDKRGHVVEWVEKASFARLNKLFEIAAAERHYETLLTARNLLAVEVKEADVEKREHSLTIGRGGKKRELCGRLLGKNAAHLPSRSEKSCPTLYFKRTGHLAGLNHSGPSMSAVGRLALLAEEVASINQPGSPHPDVDTARPFVRKYCLLWQPQWRKWGRKPELPSGGPSLLALVP